MRAQCRWIVLGEGATLGVKLATGITKGRRWPKENLNKPRAWRKSGFPGPVLWKEEKEASK